MQNESFNLIDDFELAFGDLDFDCLSELWNSVEKENKNEEQRNLDSELEFDEYGGPWVKRRRLKKGSKDYNLRKEKFKIQNRISAIRSIEKKKAYIQELEATVEKLKAKNVFMKRALQLFPDSKPAGRLCGLRKCFSTSDFYLPREDVNEKADSVYI